MEHIKTILKELGVLEAAQTIYISLLTDGEATATTLSRRTGITRTSVYDQLRDLRNRNLVSEREIEGKTFFTATDTKNLETILDEKIEHLERERGSLKSALSSLPHQTSATQPKVRFFEGMLGVQSMMKDLLWYDEELKIYWPYKSMVDAMDETFLVWFNERRIRRGIGAKTIWPESERKISHIFVEKDDLITRKYAPKKYASSMGYIIYENKVAFISSSKEAFGFIVDSVEFSALKQTEFKILWEMSSK